MAEDPKPTAGNEAAPPGAEGGAPDPSAVANAAAGAVEKAGGKPAPMATFKRELRKEIKRRGGEVEINFLNITAMLDMMTIILVFVLKSMSSSSASLPQSSDLTIPSSILTTEAS